MRQVGRLLTVYGLLGVVAGAWAVGFVETVDVLRFVQLTVISG